MPLKPRALKYWVHEAGLRVGVLATDRIAEDGQSAELVPIGKEPVTDREARLWEETCGGEAASQVAYSLDRTVEVVGIELTIIERIRQSRGNVHALVDVTGRAENQVHAYPRGPH